MAASLALDVSELEKLCELPMEPALREAVPFQNYVYERMEV